MIANRGEIALRVLRACRELGIETVAVYSQADADALHVQLAGQAVCIGPARAADSYLNQDALLTVAKATGCDGVHPGYGFLSENADFADACAAAGLTFIGPSGDAIRKAGSKSAARDLMRAAGVPVTPGSDGPVASVEEALTAAESVGYPVLLKASAGGGGRGIRRCDRPEDLSAAFAEAKAEAQACFGNDEMYLEKLVLRPRHIEFQVLADRYGNVIHLGDRDCSVQRRNQKLIEEAPARCLTPELRERMGAAAVKAAKAVGYENAGTVEFLLDPDREHFYFMEMNTRIQVEHGVTELVTGVDLVRQQLRIASGLALRLRQEDVTLQGHAIECPTYDYTIHNRAAETITIEPRKVIVVEGILIFASRVLCDQMDIKIFVDADADVRLCRRIRRDVKKRGRTIDSVIEQYLTTVKPMHEQFVEPSKKNANLIVPEGGKNLIALEMIINRIQKHIDMA